MENRIRILALISIILLVTLFLGVGMNQSVKSLNGGKMPVYTNFKLNSPNHFAFTDKSQVNAYFLTDKIYFGIGNLTVYSLGDVFIYLGGYGFLLIMTIDIIIMGIFAIKSIKEKNDKRSYY
jgi:hypothetical protein